jgi:hypothetical protein
MIYLYTHALYSPACRQHASYSPLGTPSHIGHPVAAHQGMSLERRDLQQKESWLVSAIDDPIEWLRWATMCNQEALQAVLKVNPGGWWRTRSPSRQTGGGGDTVHSFLLFRLPPVAPTPTAKKKESNKVQFRNRQPSQIPHHLARLPWSRNVIVTFLPLFLPPA